MKVESGACIKVLESSAVLDIKLRNPVLDHLLVNILLHLPTYFGSLSCFGKLVKYARA